MDKKTKLLILLEILWWLVTAVVVVGVLYPIFNATRHYPFLGTNVLFVVVFITMTRYVFLTRYTFLASLQVLKIALVFLSIPIIFFLIQEVNRFQTYADEVGLEALFDGRPFEQVEEMVRYIKTEMLFFGMASVVSSIAFPVKMIISVWLRRNRGTA